MSHQTKIKESFKSEAAIIKAAKKFGFGVDRKRRWKVYHEFSNEVGDIVLRRNDLYMEIGFVRQADGTFEMATDFYQMYGDKVGMLDLIGENAGLLRQEIHLCAAEAEAEALGLFHSRIVGENGIVDLECTGQFATVGMGA